jgi:choline dehydrogenase-like flavoprotein
MLLLKSTNEFWPEGLANGSGQVGKNLMFHASDFIACWQKGKYSRRGPNKTIALRDFYAADGIKMGEFQSTGLAAGYGSVLYALRLLFDQSPLRRFGILRHFLRIPAYLASKLYGEATLFATIIEDFPYDGNRIVIDKDTPSGIRIEYRINDELRKRVMAMRKYLRRSLPRLRLLPMNVGITLNYGHPCGTIVAGNDAATTVLDKNCKAHDLQNLYVVDSSFMPTSGGTNPSLTIAANAQRVAEVIAAELATVNAKTGVCP